MINDIHADLIKKMSYRLWQLCHFTTCLFHRDRVKMDGIMQTTISNTFSQMKMFVFRFKCHWYLLFIFLGKNCYIQIHILLTFVITGLINNIPTLFKIIMCTKHARWVQTTVHNQNLKQIQWAPFHFLPSLYFPTKCSLFICNRFYFIKSIFVIVIHQLIIEAFRF